jgi:hypothetical protein
LFAYSVSNVSNKFPNMLNHVSYYIELDVLRLSPTNCAYGCAKCYFALHCGYIVKFKIGRIKFKIGRISKIARDSLSYCRERSKDLQ